MAQLHLHVSPGTRRNQLELQPDGELRVYLTARATDGQANRALLRLLSDRLGIPKSRVSIARGEFSRYKVVLVDGLADDELRTRLAV